MIADAPSQPDPRDHEDPLAPLRVVHRRARRLMLVTVAGTLAGVVAAATVPLWSHEERLRPVVAGSYRQQTALWRWDVDPHDAWWALGLVLLLPCVLAVWAAALAERRLARAASAAPFQVRLTETTAGSGAGRLTEAQRQARERGRREDLRTQQRYVVAQTRTDGALWAETAAVVALVLGVWTGTALAVSALGAQATPLGTWVAATSWWLGLVPVVLWGAVGAARRAVGRRRASAPQPSSATPR